MKWVIPLLLLSGSLPAIANPAVFFKAHCVQCHGAAKQKSKLRLDTLAWNPADAKNAEIWREIADRVGLGEMPPEDEPQPEAARRAPSPPPDLGQKWSARALETTERRCWYTTSGKRRPKCRRALHASLFLPPFQIDDC